jgi:hypothetical protein
MSNVSGPVGPGTKTFQRGLRTSHVVLALTATDSVCLDEIAYARVSCKIPIVPVQVISCEAPVFGLPVAPDRFPALARIGSNVPSGPEPDLRGIEAALRRETPERPWRPLLEPWDFAPFLLEKRNHFTGRQWLFRELDEWRTKEAPPALLITGAPGGIGKSGHCGRPGARETGGPGFGLSLLPS